MEGLGGLKYQSPQYFNKSRVRTHVILFATLPAKSLRTKNDTPTFKLSLYTLILMLGALTLITIQPFL